MDDLMDSEADFLAHYDARAYASPLLMVDPILFSYHEQQLKVLLVKRAVHPARGQWSLPGGFVDLSQDQDLEQTARRQVTAKTGVQPPYLEQLYSFGSAQRDPRGWSVTIAYTALIAWQACAAHLEHVQDAQWLALDQLAHDSLAFDHAQLIAAARERLRQKALYSIVPAFALAQPFSLPELQQLHETLLGKALQKKSFRRRIELAELLLDSGLKRQDQTGRPATLYYLKPEAAHYRFVRNLEE